MQHLRLGVYWLNSMQLLQSLEYRQTVNQVGEQEDQTNFCIGNVAVQNGVMLAPMSGVTDAPFRRLVSQLGAGLVVSEMTASDALIEGQPNAVLRAEGQGIGTHVVQLAGCETHWMAEGARIA